jgi:FlaA1/EpsC-like NDP-sugar epimerase
VIYFVLLLIIRLGIRAFLPESVRNSEVNLSLLAIVQLGLAVLIQVGIAMKVARTVRSFNKVHGLFAAFTGGCVMSVSALAFNFLFGGAIDIQFAWKILSWTISWGALLSLLGMLILRLPKGRFF